MDLAALRTPMQRIMRRSGNHLLMHQCCQQKERDNFGREIDGRIRILKKSDHTRRRGGPLACSDCFEGRMDGWIRILKKWDPDVRTTTTTTTRTHGSWESKASVWRLFIEEIRFDRYSFRDRYLSLNINLLHPVVQQEYMPANLVPFTPCMCQIVLALGILKLKKWFGIVFQRIRLALTYSPNLRGRGGGVEGGYP